MATVTGLTAERMIQIENASITNARMENGDLILTTHEGTDINVGKVSGFTDDDVAAFVSTVGTATGDAVKTLITQQRVAKGIPVGVAGRDYAMVLGVISNDGTGFKLLNDANHESTLIDSISQTAQGITINYASSSFGKVASLIAVPDEVLTAAGFSCGMSPGLAQSVLSIYKDAEPVQGYIFYDGSTFVIDPGSKGILSVETLNGTNSGELVINHDPVSGFGCSLVPISNVYRMSIGVVGVITSTETSVTFIDNTGAIASVPDGNMKFTIVRNGTAKKLVDPATINITAYPSSDIWIIGIMEKAVA